MVYVSHIPGLYIWTPKQKTDVTKFLFPAQIALRDNLGAITSSFSRIDAYSVIQKFLLGTWLDFAVITERQVTFGGLGIG